jgi:hypothetical protein
MYRVGDAQRRLIFGVIVLILVIAVFRSAKTRTRNLSGTKSRGKFRQGQEKTMADSGAHHEGEGSVMFRQLAAQDAEKGQRDWVRVLVADGGSTMNWLLAAAATSGPTAIRRHWNIICAMRYKETKVKIRTIYSNVSTQARVETSIARLGSYRGRVRKRDGWVFAGVSGIGIVGMFSAIVGAMIGLWLDEASEDADDGDHFCFWEEATSHGNERSDIDDIGAEREEHYSNMRAAGCLLYSD